MKLNHITRRAFTLSFITLVALALTAIVGCSKNDSLPTEFKLTRVLHQKKVSHLMGPGGGESFLYCLRTTKGSLRNDCGSRSDLPEFPALSAGEESSRQDSIQWTFC